MRRGGLARRYLVVLVALVTGALVTGGAIQLRASYLENQAALVALQREKALGAAARIEAFVRDIERQLGWTTHAPLVTTDAALDARQLDALRLQRQAPPITELTYIDATGREQLFVSRLIPDRRRSGLDASQEPRFRETRGGRAWFGPVYFRKDSEPYMTIAAPLAGGGVAAADVNLKFILDVVSQIKVGTTGLAYAVDGQGALIAHPDISLVLQKTDLSPLPHVRLALTPSPEDDPITGRDVKGVEVLTAHSRIPSLGWVVFVEQPVAEAFAPVRASAYGVIIVVAVGIALSVVVSVVLARRLARPIQTLQQSAARIGAGELDHQIALTTGDELEALADEFNRMTGRLRESYATLEQKVEDRTHELSESLEQQTATAEILGVISASPTDVQPVFEAILANATRLCAAERGIAFAYNGRAFHAIACRGLSAEAEADFRDPARSAPTPASALGRMLAGRRPVHIEDITDDEAYRAGDPLRLRTVRLLGARTAVWLPLLRGDDVIGALVIYRQEVRRFTDKQIELLQTFADQAVIAIENVRLFKELETRNAALTESLSQQTATSDILRVISQSQTDVQPVFETIVQSAVRLSGASHGGAYRFDGELVHPIANYGYTPEQLELWRRTWPRRLTAQSAACEAIRTGAVARLRDVEAPGLALTEATRAALRARGTRSVLAVPMLRQGEVIGSISLAHHTVDGFTDAHVELLKTFADQAVIAVQNVRLFTELEARNAALTESLDQQTATSEILRVISSSPTSVQPVLDAVAESAARVCGATDALILRVEGSMTRRVAHFGSVPLLLPEVRPIDRDSVSGRAILEGRAIHVKDVTEPANLMEYPLHQRTAAGGEWRTHLTVPLMREGVAIGAITIRRGEVRPFTDKQIALLQTFADQAVIAIENVRLFKELEEKNAALAETLEQQTATGEILRSISSSPTDVQPVFDTIAASALRLLDAHSANVIRLIDDHLHIAALTSKDPASDAVVRASFPVPLTRTGIGSHVARTRRPYIVVDVGTDSIVSDTMRRNASARGYRSVLTVPMLRDERVIGLIMLTRPNPGAFNDDEVGLLTTFADQAVIAIENVRLFTELQARTADLTRSVGELEALGEVSRAISSTLDIDRVLETIVSRANALAGTDGGAIYEFDEPTRRFHLRATDKFPDGFVAGLRATPLVYGEGAAGRAAAERQPVQIGDVSDAVVYGGPVRDLLLASGYRSLLAVPLLAEDEVVGALVVNRRAPGEFPSRVVELLRTFGTQSALAIQNARLFREIEDKSRELESANRHKDEFLASMSHELRTPLNAVIGFSEVLLERMFGDVNAKQEEYLNDILASGRHLLSLINDILDLAKIEAGRMELDLEDFELAPAIDNALVLIRERATRKGLTLDTRLPAGLGSARGDQRKIKQVLVNLLSNAVKFTSEGGRIEVRAERVDGQVEVSVIDTGIGIAPEDHEAVFEEFRQVGTDYAKKHEGTGLGLALARKFVELHGGRIWLKSQPGEGSTFTFTIPVA